MDVPVKEPENGNLGVQRGSFSPRTPSKSLHTGLSGHWQPMLESDCTFQPEMFLRVMNNLIKNPNIMSSHLFRADILYDSENDHTIIETPEAEHFSDYTRHLKQECQPKWISVPGYEWQKTYVRQLVPRNRQLDKDLIQTCHFFAQHDGSNTRNLILYLPHVDDVEHMPWYHPKVQVVAFYHDWTATLKAGDVSVHYLLYPDVPVDTRLERTALQLLTKIHKHGRGQQAGYQKRVHHDQVVTQKRFQETYARLKSTYARSVIANWVEDTDPGKHVFEDLGIASFLIELWTDMYDCSAIGSRTHGGVESTKEHEKPPFPGFVDIGCGNGLLVNLLLMEGFPGWGFDARQRKTWNKFAPEIKKQVVEAVLVPEVLNLNGTASDNDSKEADSNDAMELDGSREADLADLMELDGPSKDWNFHNGLFDKGTFILSNHADELTPWTPLLAYLNDSPFIAIPCCSHNLAGAKWRAPASQRAKEKAAALRRQEASKKDDGYGDEDKMRISQAAETGSLKLPAGTKNVQSAYASLCDYVSGLAEEVGFIVETEVLRIPSTRNMCILGRRREPSQRLSEISASYDDAHSENQWLRREQVRNMVARELNAPIDDICRDFVKRAQQIAGKKGDGH